MPKYKLQQIKKVGKTVSMGTGNPADNRIMVRLACIRINLSKNHKY